MILGLVVRGWGRGELRSFSIKLKKV